MGAWKELRRPSPPVVAAAVIAVVVLVHAVRTPAPVAPPATRADDRVDDDIAGVVVGPVDRAPHGWGARVEIDGGVADDVWLWSPVALEPGDAIAATGRLRTPRGMDDPGAQPRPVHAAWEMSASRVEIVARGGGGAGAAIWRWAARTQAAWASAIDDAVGDRRDPGGAALRGIVTGDRGDVPDDLDRRWRATGIFHALSVSGLHLAVVAGLAFALLCKLAAASPWGGRIRPARWAAPPALAIATAYTLITGAQIATVRALVVVAVALIARALDRPLRLVDAIGVAVIALVASQPSCVADPSFQLSFAAALALALRPHMSRPTTTTRARRAIDWIVRGATTSLWIAIVTAPITAYHFHQVAAGGVIGNLALTPLLELVALPAGLAGLAIGGAVGARVLAAAAFVCGAVDAAAGVLARATPLGHVAIASPALMAALVVLSLALCARAQRSRRDALGWLALCALWALGRTPPPPGALRVTFMDVGQGDAAIVELPDGNVWLVDAGGLPSRGDLASAAAPGVAITRALEAYGHASVDLAVISHPHPDHYLGLAALGVPVAELWTADESALPAAAPAPAKPSDLPSLSAIARALGARVVHPPLGLARAEAGVELHVWAPRFRERDAGSEREAADPVRSVNDNSLVVELRFAGRSLLFTGDVEAEGEDALVAAGVGREDVVKVAHHGSPTSSTARFVAATRPALAVISCGVANTFGFPAPAVVARWTAAGARVARTDRDGAVVIAIAPTGELAVDP